MADFLLAHKNKIIIGAVIVLILGAAFLWGGNREETVPVSSAAPTSVSAPSESPAAESSAPPEETEMPPAESPQITALLEIESEKAIEETEVQEEINIAPEPAEAPVYTEMYNDSQPEVKNICTLTVRCDDILKNMDRLNPDKKGLVPSDGIIFAAQAVEFNEGESVFNVLQREMKRNKIHMEFVNTLSTNSIYIEGINNLYEFDCGERSGWLYSVNGKYPNVSCSQYKLKAGDTVEFTYTCG